ncbi:MAG: hypothetical protein AB7T63_16885 [Planctomycetota bacterium]
MVTSGNTEEVPLPWPDVECQSRPGETARALLDYVAWIAKEMRQLGFHGGSRREEWRRRVHQAYAALFVPPVPGYGDPYPPDVPPPRTPGTWPDIPSASVPGMTVRHQLSVIGHLAAQLRDKDWMHARRGETEIWDGRLARARAALDHGDAKPMPEEARTTTPEATIQAVASIRAARAEKAKRRAAQERAAKRAAKKAAKSANAAPRQAPAKKAPKADTPARAPKTKTATPKQKTAAKKGPPKKKAAATKKKAAAKPKKAAKKKSTGSRKK